MVDDAFAPLLLSSSSSSGGGGESSKPLVKPGAAKKRLRNAVWEGQLVKQVKAVESELREKAESQELAIQSSIIKSLPELSRQLTDATSLRTRLADAQNAATSLSSALGDMASLSAPLVPLLDRRAAVLHRLTVATAHERALRQLARRSAALDRIAQALRQGQVRLEDGDLSLGLGAALDRDREARSSKSISTGLRKSKPWTALDKKANDLRRKAASTISNALESALAVSSKRVVVRAHVGLTADESSEPLLPLSSVVEAAQELGLLEQHLHAFFKRIREQVIKPLLGSGSGSHDVEPDDEDLDVLKLVTSTNSELSSDDDELPTSGIWTTLSFLIERLGPCYDGSSKEGEPQQKSSGGLAVCNALEGIIRLTLDDLLQTRLLGGGDKKSMPTSVDGLPGWLERVSASVELEKAIQSAWTAHLPDHPAVFTSLEEFAADGKAALAWAGARRAEIVGNIRRLICGNWDNWKATEVRRETTIQPASSEPADAESKPSNGETRGKAAQETEHPDAADDEEDGWAFEDEEISAESKTDTKSTPAEDQETGDGSGDADGDGWAFEDDDLETLAAKPQPMIAPPPNPIASGKIIKQAKHIGKKGKHTNTGDSVPSPPEPTVEPTPIVDGSSPDGPVADGWNVDWDDRPADQPASQTIESIPPSPPKPTVVTETFMVSTALRSLAGAIEDALKYATTVRNLPQSESSESVGAVLRGAAIDGLDLYRALMPVVHAGQALEVPALAMQFHNDCAELARSVTQLKERYGWDGGECEQRLSALSVSTFERQMRLQETALSDLLAETDEFSDISDQIVFEKDLRILEDVRLKIEALYRVWMDVLPAETCLTSIGRLIDGVLDDICRFILQFDDITADESDRIHQLCKALTSFEALFASRGASIVGHSTHWLRFNYLAELMEASLADITYLWETGALVDFTSDQLVHLLLALFTDTPLRAEVIGKVSGRSSLSG